MTIAEYLEQSGESVAQLAARAGLAPSTVYRLRGGACGGRVDSLVRLSHATGGKITSIDGKPRGKRA